MTDSEREARLRTKGRTVKWLTWALGLMLALGMGSTVVISQYELQATRKGTDRLVDCTTPGGKCYEQGRSSTSGAVGTINKVTISAIYCSGKLGPTATVAALNACVAALIG